MEGARSETSLWFRSLRDSLREAFEGIESSYAEKNSLTPGRFEVRKWDREGGGGGEMSVMRGNVFEKVGVNISTVYGSFSQEFAGQIPGAADSDSFFATGISVIAHMRSPLVPAVHFNTRYIETSKSWFGGGSDLTPTYPDPEETSAFHGAFKEACDRSDPGYYPEFKKKCDEYFYLPHRKEPRGVGGIFYDYLNTGDFSRDFSFTKDVGKAFLKIYPQIVEFKMNLPWTDKQREELLLKRGRYVEFNLLHDRGTKFGLMSGGDIEAILTSMPPEVRW